MSAATITVNGQEAQLHRGETVADVLGRIGVGHEPRGVAVAVDGEVVPRGRWGEHPVTAGARLEIVGATQGG